ncbi:MAG: hypothetical protein HFG05_04410 [Oscillibacter sp.]|nr:hypothetical protein [Oscillibacter sp.]
MKKPKCFLAHKVTLLLLAVGIILAQLIIYFRRQDPGAFQTGVASLLILPVLAGGLIARKGIVCPHCGAQLFQGRFVRFHLPERCPECKKELTKEQE